MSIHFPLNSELDLAVNKHWFFLLISVHKIWK